MYFLCLHCVENSSLFSLTLVLFISQPVSENKPAESFLLPHNVRTCFERAEKIDWALWLDDRRILLPCQRHEITGDTWSMIIKSTYPGTSPWPLVLWCHQHAGGLPAILNKILSIVKGLTGTIFISPSVWSLRWWVWIAAMTVSVLVSIKLSESVFCSC